MLVNVKVNLAIFESILPFIFYSNEYFYFINKLVCLFQLMSKLDHSFFSVDVVAASQFKLNDSKNVSNLGLLTWPQNKKMSGKKHRKKIFLQNKWPVKLLY